MRIKNGRVFINKSFSNADICFDSKIRAIGSLNEPADYDAKGCYIIPGLVDIHTHGAVGEDFSDGNLSALHKLSNYYANHGVTSYLATTMTLPEPAATRSSETSKVMGTVER